MALSKQNWKDILDQIYNNGNYYETYSEDNKNGLLLYTNSLSNVDVVYRREVSQNGIDTYIVGIFPKKNWAYTDSQTQEQGVYICKVINDDVITNQVSQIYASGASGWLNIKSYIRNILVFLGLKTDKDFDEKNPALYQELVNICHKYFDTGKAPYYFGKYIRSGTDNYSTYVQHGVIKDIAIYLNGIGIFRGDKNHNLLVDQFINSNSTGDISNLPKFNEIYNVVSEDKAKNLFKDFFSTRFEKLTDGTTPEDIINYFMLQFGNEIDFSKALFCACSEEFLVYNRAALFLYEFPNDCVISLDNKYNIFYNGLCVPALKAIYNDNDFSYVYYKVDFKVGKDPIHLKGTHQIKGGTTYIFNNISSDTRYGIFNVDKSFVKTYGGKSIVYNSGRESEPLEYFPELQDNTTYVIGSSLKLLDKRYMLCTGDYYYTDSVKYVDSSSIYNAIKNLSINDKDIMCSFKAKNITTNTEEDLFFIIRNVNTVSFTNVDYLVSKIRDVMFNIVHTAYYSGNVHEIPLLFGCYNYYKESTFENSTLTFDEPKVLELYNKNGLITSLTTNITFSFNDLTTLGYSFDKGEYIVFNFGEFIEYKDSNKFEGIEKITGATYPSNVIDEPSFNTFVNSINGAFNPIRNPYYLDGELQDTTNIEFWLQCTTYKNPPATQAEAVTNDIEDMPDDEVKELEKTIDPDVDPNDDEDEDEDSKDNPDDYKKDENEGKNDIPTIDDVFHYGYSSFINQWVLNKANLNEFGKAINNKDFIDLIVGLIADPLDALISLQVVPISLMPTFDTTARHIYIRGQELFYKIAGATEVTTTYPVGFLLLDNVSEFDLGEIEIGKIHDNYLDVVETKFTLYLPFAGNIELDIRDFYGGSIHIKGFCETYTGQLIYYVISKVDNLSRIITTITANCFSSIPLKSDGFASLLNGFTRG